MIRAVVYARYSSDLQSAASIEDQIRLCRERIGREGWVCQQTYDDRAASGASALRSAYQRLLEDARSRKFDVVVAEALDRLSRDQEDVAALYKRLKFAGIRLLTLAEGDVTELHVGLKGTMNALFIKDLAEKTRRGLRGRVEAGLSAGGNSFGYRVVREMDERGQPATGRRAIDAGEAEVVRRIFREFSAGHSPRAIAMRLNRESVAGPGGRPWGDTTIRGHAARGTGILHNELYIGRLVWNRQRYLKDPETGKRLARPNPPEEWIVQEVPDLRVVPDALWEEAQARLRGIRESAGPRKIRASGFWSRRRARHLITGRVFCGVCRAAMIASGKDYLACGTARRQGTCANRTSIRRPALEELVVDALRHNLMQPHLVEEFVRAFTEETNRMRAIADQDRSAGRRELAEVSRRLEGLIEAIADGLRTPGLKAKLEELERRKAVLEAEIAAAPAPEPRLHPNLAELYRRRVEDLQAALSDPQIRTEAADTLRSLIEAINVHPTEKGQEIELVGDIANMVRVASEGAGNKKAAPEGAAVRETFARSVKVVAGAGFEPTTFRL